jgi:hypothetical protein
MEELADHTGMPVRRLAKIQSYQVTMPSEAPFGGTLNDNPMDFSQDAIDYVYHDADHTDRKILELKTGYGGVQTLDPQAVGAKLGLSPSQLSRRSMRLAKRVQEMQDAMEHI